MSSNRVQPRASSTSRRTPCWPVISSTYSATASVRVRAPWVSMAASRPTRRSSRASRSTVVPLVAMTHTVALPFGRYLENLGSRYQTCDAHGHSGEVSVEASAQRFLVVVPTDRCMSCRAKVRHRHGTGVLPAGNVSHGEGVEPNGLVVKARTSQHGFGPGRERHRLRVKAGGPFQVNDQCVGDAFNPRPPSWAFSTASTSQLCVVLCLWDSTVRGTSMYRNGQRGTLCQLYRSGLFVSSRRARLR